MEIDLDTLIYIFVMILFVVLGSLGKKKRPARQTSVSTSGEELFEDPEKVLTERLRTLIGNYSQEEPLTQRGHIEISESEPVSQEAKTEKIFEPFQKYEADLVSTDVFTDQFDDIHNESEEGVSVFEKYDYSDSDLRDGDLTREDSSISSGLAENLIIEEIHKEMDLKRAIIYSEILNRKYI